MCSNINKSVGEEGGGEGEMRAGGGGSDENGRGTEAKLIFQGGMGRARSLEFPRDGSSSSDTVDLP